MDRARTVYLLINGHLGSFHLWAVGCPNTLAPNCSISFLKQQNCHVQPTWGKLEEIKWKKPSPVKQWYQIVLIHRRDHWTTARMHLLNITIFSLSFSHLSYSSSSYTVVSVTLDNPSLPVYASPPALSASMHDTNTCLLFFVWNLRHMYVPSSSSMPNTMVLSWGKLCPPQGEINSDCRHFELSHLSMLLTPVGRAQGWC